MTDFKQLMLNFAHNGFYVFPKLNRFKDSNYMPPGWNHNRETKTGWESSNDVTQVMEWLAVPDLLGFGVNRRDDCLIIDVDSGKKQEALQSLQFLKTDLKLPQASMTVRTKSGGYHLYYDHPGIDIKLSINILPGIDLPLHCVGPGSIGKWEKGNYTIIHGRIDNILQPISNEFKTWLEKNISSKKQSSVTHSLVSPVEAILLKGEIPKSIPSGERHITLLRLIGSWVRSGYPRENILTLLMTAIERCDGGPPERVEAYIERIDETLGKSSFNRPVPEPLDFFIKNAIYVKDHDGVFEIPSRRMYVKGLQNVYAQYHYYEEIETPTGKTKTCKKYALTEWVHHKDRRTVDSFGYKPSGELMFFDHAQRCNVVNTYIAPEFPNPESTEAYDRFIKFITFMCGPKADFVLDWAAWIVKHPDIKLQFALALISETHGVGKNLFFKIVERCVGIHNTIEFTLDKLFSPHNDYPMNTHLAIINETQVDLSDRFNSKKHKEIIEIVKDLITNDVATVNPKFVKISQVSSYVNYGFTSNNLHGIPLDEKDRRFEIVICSKKLYSTEEYSFFWNMTNKDIAAIREGLISRAAGKVNERYSPNKPDEAKLAVINAGRSFIEIDIANAIINKDGVFAKDVVTFELFGWYVVNNISSITQSHARDLFKKFCKPIYRKGVNQARDAMVSVPAVEYKGNDYQKASTKPRYLYCCRDADYYNSDDCRETVPTKHLKDSYDVNLAATTSQPKNLQLVKQA